MTDQHHLSEIPNTLDEPEDVRHVAAEDSAETSDNLPPNWVDPARNPHDDHSMMLRTAILQPSAEIMALGAKRNRLRTEEPCLILHSGKAKGTAINLLPMDKETISTWIIGCEADCDVLLHEVGVSAFHAMVVHNDGQWTLTDQQSASGTFVNGKPCLKRVLHDGDQLQFGRVKGTFHIPKAYRSPNQVSEAQRLLRALKTLVAIPLSWLGRRTS